MLIEMSDEDAAAIRKLISYWARTREADARAAKGSTSRGSGDRYKCAEADARAANGLLSRFNGASVPVPAAVPAVPVIHIIAPPSEPGAIQEAQTAPHRREIPAWQKPKPKD